MNQATQHPSETVNLNPVLNQEYRSIAEQAVIARDLAEANNQIALAHGDSVASARHIKLRDDLHELWRAAWNLSRNFVPETETAS